MEIQKALLQSEAIRFSATEDGKEVGRAFLYIIKNDLHDQSYGFMEDLFVEESHRKHGIGRQLVEEMIAEAKIRGCYKILGTSRRERPEVHEFYKKFGFKDYGLEFRLDL